MTTEITKDKPEALQRPGEFVRAYLTRYEYQALINLRNIQKTDAHAEVHFKKDGVIRVYKVSKELEKAESLTC